MGIVALAGCDLYTNEAIAGIIPKDDRVLPKYLYFLLPHIDYTAYMQSATKGKTLNKEIIQQVKIPVPSLKKQQELIDAMEKEEEEKAKLMSMIQTVENREAKLIAKWIT